MTDVESNSTASSVVRKLRSRPALIRLLPAALLIIVPAITLPVVVPTPVAGADQISSLQAEAAQLSHQILQEQLQVGAYQVQYQVDSQQVQEDAARIDRTDSSIAADQRRVGQDTAVVRHDAILTLTGAATTNERLLRMFSSDQTQALARDEYQQVAAGTTLAALARLHGDQGRLRAQEADLRAQEQQDSAVQQQAAAALDSAQTTAQTLQSQQSSITGQLAQAVAAQQATEAAAAQRAAQAAAQQGASQAAAQQAAAAQAAAQTVDQSAASTTAAAPVSAPVVTGSSDGLPPILQCILQAESGGNYAAVSPNGEYMGGFQFSQSSWNYAAELAGEPQLIGVPPNEATPAEQNELALALYAADGEQPWVDPCTA